MRNRPISRMQGVTARVVALRAQGSGELMERQRIPTTLHR